MRHPVNYNYDTDNYDQLPEFSEQVMFRFFVLFFTSYPKSNFNQIPFLEGKGAVSGSMWGKLELVPFKGSNLKT